MEWFRVHPYVSAIGATLFLFLSGSIVVGRSVPTTPAATHAITWDGSGSASNPLFSGSNSENGTQSRATIMQQVQRSAPYTYIAPTVPQNADNQTSPDGSFDFDAFIKVLSSSSAHPASQKPSTGTSGPAGGYAFIPSGLVAQRSTASSRSPLQQALYEYGNDIGSSIQSFEADHPNEAKTLKDQAEDRTDPAKAAALEKLGKDLSSLGSALLGMDTTPPSAVSLHKALAQSYIEIGGNLILVAKAGSDSNFIKAITVYDGSVETFVNRYVALAQFFGAYGVTFAQEDAGSVFSFSPGGF